MGKIIGWVVRGFFAMGLIYLMLLAIASYRQGYSWDEMDWRQRGETSLLDFMAASDIGKREVEKEGKKCIEYFAYKDGLAVKVTCP